MTDKLREAMALARLLKIARSKTDETSRRLAFLEASLEHTQETLDLLADAIRSEESAARSAEAVGFLHLAGFLAGAAKKRAALLETRSAIRSEIAAQRALLEEAFGEMKRLDHLSGAAAARIAEDERKRENSLIESAARDRFLRRRSR